MIRLDRDLQILLLPLTCPHKLKLYWYYSFSPKLGVKVSLHKGSKYIPCILPKLGQTFLKIKS